MLCSQRMAKELASEAIMTRSLLAKIPDDKLAWQPMENLRTIGWNATHLVEIVGWVAGVIQESEFDVAPVDGQAYVPPTATHTSELLERFDAQLKTALAALEGVSDEALEESWSLKMAGQTLFTLTKRDCLRKWVFSHTAHHRGILSTYLRLAGESITSVYEA